MVAPFLEEYSEQVNIPIFTSATSYTMKLGEVVIINLFCQGLWFVNNMEKTLTNPNKCQFFWHTNM